LRFEDIFSVAASGGLSKNTTLGEIMMTDNQNLDDVFIKPSIPKSSWQLLSWLIFEPFLLQMYSKNSEQNKTLPVLAKCYLWTILIYALFYLVCITLIINLDLPLRFPTQFSSKLISDFSKEYSTIDLYFLYIKHFGKSLMFLVIIVVVFFLNDKLDKTLNITNGIIGLAASLIFTLMIGFGEIFELSDATLSASAGATFGMYMGLFIMYINRFVGLAIGLGLWLAPVLIVGAKLGSDIGLDVGLPASMAFYLSYFRLPFYPFYCFYKMDFYTSPYHSSAVIFLPILGAKQRLCNLAINTPETALKFVKFLRTYRPLQTKLADYISHAALSGMWKHQVLEFEVLTPPFIENQKLKPTDDWLKQLDQVKTQLIAYHDQTKISFKKSEFEKFVVELENFKQRTLSQNKDWHDYYLQAINVWQQAAKEELQVQRQQPLQICTDI
jgi:hypothetical protein